MDIVQLIINPDGFFKKLSEKEVSFKMPFLIVSLVTIVSTIYSYYSTSIITNIYPSEMATMKTIMIISTVIGSFLGLYISWLIISILFYLISILFKGEGSLKRVIEFVGYGYLPNILGSIVISIVGFYFLSNIHIEPLTMSQITNPTIIKEITNNIVPKPFIIFVLVVNIGIAIWNFIIWTFGIKYARNLPINKAAIVVALPTILFLLITVGSLIPKLLS